MNQITYFFNVAVSDGFPYSVLDKGVFFKTLDQHNHRTRWCVLRVHLSSDMLYYLFSHCRLYLNGCTMISGVGIQQVLKSTVQLIKSANG